MLETITAMIVPFASAARVHVLMRPLLAAITTLGTRTLSNVCISRDCSFCVCMQANIASECVHSVVRVADSLMRNLAEA
jgi:hypothetical protein